MLIVFLLIFSSYQANSQIDTLHYNSFELVNYVNQMTKKVEVDSLTGDTVKVYLGILYDFSDKIHREKGKIYIIYKCNDKIAAKGKLRLKKRFLRRDKIIEIGYSEYFDKNGIITDSFYY